MTRITILILSVNEAPLLRHSLPAACAQGADEVVVIDDACTDATPELCQRWGARRLRLTTRRGYAAAMNAGLAACGGDWVLWCNADCVLSEGFLDALRPHLDDPAVGVLVPRLLRASGMEPEDRTDALDAAGMTIDRRRKNSLVGHGDPGSTRTAPGPVFGGDGACVLYRRECLDTCALGLEVLDEDMDLWATDADLAWRARLFGWEARYVPAATAWHKRFYSPSNRHRVDRRHRRLQFRNRLLMIVKNETRSGLLRHLPFLAAYEVAALGWCLLREPFLLRGYLDALRLLPGARARRRFVQRRRRERRAALPRVRRPPAVPPFGLAAPETAPAPIVAPVEAQPLAGGRRR